MKFEELIYRGSSAFLSLNCCIKGIKMCNILCQILTFISTIIFLLLILSQSQREQYFNQLEKINYDLETVYILTVIDNEYQSEDDSIFQFLLTNNKEYLKADLQFLKKYNFTTKSIVINIEEYLDSYYQLFYFSTNLQTILFIDLNQFQQHTNYFIKNLKTRQTFNFNNNDFLEKDQNYILNRIWQISKIIFQCLFGLFLLYSGISIFLQIYIYCAPTFQFFGFYLLCCCTNELPPFEFQNRVYPWIGNYLQVLVRNNKSIRSLILSFVMLYQFEYFFLAYIGDESGRWISDKAISTGVMFFKYCFVFISIQVIYQSLALYFFRTRSSLYFLPKIIMLLNLIFLFYYKSNQIGYIDQALKIMIFSQFSAIFYFLKKFELASIEWSTESPYTPTQNRPRVFYSPLFNMNWVEEIPQIWSIFTPYCGRKYFTNSQLSLVDKNYLLLNFTLNQNQVNEQVIQQQQPQIIVQNQIQDELQNLQNQ